MSVASRKSFASTAATTSTAAVAVPDVGTTNAKTGTYLKNPISLMLPALTRFVVLCCVVGVCSKYSGAAVSIAGVAPIRTAPQINTQ